MPVIRRQAGRTPPRRDRRVVAPPGLEPDAVPTYLTSHRTPRAAPAVPSRVRLHVGGRAGRLAVMYAVGAAAWIVGTSWVTKAVDGGATFEMFKGLAFVVATAALLFAVLVTHERSVEASARRMRDLIESAGDVAYRYRRWPTSGFEYISDAITDWVGVTPDEHYRRPDIGVFLVHPGDRKRLSDLLLLGTTTASVPLRWLTPDGRVLHTLHDVREVCDRRGRVIAVEGRIRDVTEERRGHGESAVAEGILAGLAGDLDATGIARSTCDRLVVLMEVDIAWVGVPLDDGSVRIVASHGGTRYVDGLVVRWDDTPHGQGPAGIAVREHRSVTMDPLQFGYGPWRQRAMDDGVTAALAVPLVWQGVAIGVLTVYSRFGNPFDQAFVARFERTAERLALAMATARRLADDRESTPQRITGVIEPFDVGAALADGRIEPWWQPQVTCPGARVAALEVLVRGRTIDGDVVLPHIVLPMAEEAGLMVQLGRAVRRRALAEASRWFELGVERVALNASVVELVEPGFAIELLRLLDEHGVPHDRIELEIVETAPLDARSVRALTEIAAAGVRVAVDDYGSGWASLGHLAQLPATTLKIDRVFVRDIGSSARADQLVRSTFELAQALGLVAVAEGVETPEQAHALEDMGCHLLQGFLFATPMPTLEVEQLLRAAPRRDGAGDWARALLAP